MNGTCSRLRIALQGPASEQSQHSCSSHWPRCLRMFAEDDITTTNQKHKHTHTTRGRTDGRACMCFFYTYMCIQKRAHIYIYIYVYTYIHFFHFGARESCTDARLANPNSGETQVSKTSWERRGQNRRKRSQEQQTRSEGSVAEPKAEGRRYEQAV